MQRSIVCEACKVFEPIFDQCTKKHKARVYIISFFWGGAKLEGLGGEGASPPHLPVDETL